MVTLPWAAVPFPDKPFDEEFLVNCLAAGTVLGHFRSVVRTPQALVVAQEEEPAASQQQQGGKFHKQGG